MLELSKSRSKSPSVDEATKKKLTSPEKVSLKNLNTALTPVTELPPPNLPIAADEPRTLGRQEEMKILDSNTYYDIDPLRVVGPVVSNDLQFAKKVSSINYQNSSPFK